MEDLNVEVYQNFKGAETNKYGFPEPLRCLILGSSGSGKTTLMLNFIFQDWLRFKRVIIFSTTLHQKTYASLRLAQQQLNEKGKGFCEVTVEGEKIRKPFISFHDKVVAISELKGDDILIVFDDMVLESQKEIGKYFVVGRHRNFHVLFLAQNYGKVDRQTIKSNLNYLCIFKQPHFYLKQIHEDFVATRDFTQFVKNCEESWRETPHSFARIDLNLLS
jgi:GTPase SAR1 family protein